MKITSVDGLEFDGILYWLELVVSLNGFTDTKQFESLVHDTTACDAKD
jgi:hypothetical protein